MKTGRGGKKLTEMLQEGYGVESATKPKVKDKDDTRTDAQIRLDMARGWYANGKGRVLK